MYKHVALGGTFDLLHIGHIALLNRASLISKFVSIGITTDKFCQSLDKFPYENQSKRKRNLIAYLAKNNLTKRYKIIWLNDIFGTTIRDPSIEALVVSKETAAGAASINRERAKKKLKPLKVIICKEILAQDGKRVSSGRVRTGEVSPEGASYAIYLSKIAGIRFSNKIRKNLKKPFGPIVKITKKIKSKEPSICVGDATTANFLKADIVPKLAIVDFYIRRQRVYQNLHELGFAQPNPDVIVKNPPGQISKSLVLEVEKALRRKSTNQIILVKGEEDLAVIPTVLLSPLGTTVFYGQPQRGAIQITVDLKTKQKLLDLLS